jgi:hypothetical protein
MRFTGYATLIEFVAIQFASMRMIVAWPTQRTQIIPSVTQFRIISARDNMVNVFARLATRGAGWMRTQEPAA